MVPTTDTTRRRGCTAAILPARVESGRLGFLGFARPAPRQEGQKRLTGGQVACCPLTANEAAGR